MQAYIYAQLCIVELAAPLDGLGDGTGGRYFAERGVGVGGVDVAVGAEDLAYVLGEVKAVGTPGAVLLDGQRAGGIASGRAAKGIIAVLSLHHQGAAAVVGHADGLSTTCLFVLLVAPHIGMEAFISSFVGFP